MIDDLKKLTEGWGLLAAVVAGVAGAILWHYAQFQTVSASETKWLAMEQSIDRQTLTSLKKELRQYRGQLAMLPSDPKNDSPAQAKERAWIQSLIAEVEETIECIKSQEPVC